MSIKLATNAELSGENDKIGILTVIAPDANLNVKPSACTLRTYIRMFKRTEGLLDVLRKKSAAELESLMKLKKKLAESHVQRFQAFERLPPKQAVLLFGGKGLDAEDFDDDDRTYAQMHLRLLSGIFGVLRPYDDVRPVRDIPMGASLHTSRGESILEFWGDEIRKQLVKDLAAIGSGSSRVLLLGCMGEESWRAVQPRSLPDDVVAKRVVFESDDDKDVREAHGLLARYIVRNRVEDLTTLKKFTKNDWVYGSESKTEFIFVRRGGKLARVELPSERDGDGKKGRVGKDRRRHGASPSAAEHSPSREKRKNRSCSSEQPRKRKQKSCGSSPEQRRKRKRETSSSSPKRQRKKAAGKQDSKKRARHASSGSS